MGILDDLLGNSAADASRQAAQDTYAKQQAATGLLRKEGADYATNMGNLGADYTNKLTNLGASYSPLAASYNPWITTGQTANTSLNALLTDPSRLSALPGYQSDLSQGTKALDRSAAANGNLFSGRQGKALEAYGVNLADKTYGDQLSRLLGISNQGLGAQGAANSLLSRGLDVTGHGITGGANFTGQGLTGQLGANTSAYGGDMQSAGTIGQGEVAAANAKAKGTQNLFNMAAQLGGAALTGGLSGFGGFGATGTAIGSLFGGSPSYGGGSFLDSAYGGSKSSPLPGLSASDYGY